VSERRREKGRRPEGNHRETRTRRTRFLLICVPGQLSVFDCGGGFQKPLPGFYKKNAAFGGFLGGFGAF